MLNKIIRKIKALLWFFFKNIITKSKTYVNGTYIYLNPNDDKISRKCYIRNEWEKLENSKMNESCKHGTIAIDIGANIGIYTSMFSQCVGESGFVFAFEPNDENFLYLQKNTTLLKNVTIEKCAIGHYDGFIDLIVSENHKGDHRTHFDDTSIENTVKVKINKLTTLLNQKSIDYANISVVKIDTQGAEPFILYGIGNELLNFVNTTFFIEFAPWLINGNIDILKYLVFLDQNYTIYNLNYVTNEFFTINNITELHSLYNSYTNNTQGFDHSTLVIRLKKEITEITNLDFIKV